MAQTEAFCLAASELGREPHALFLARGRSTSMVRRSLAILPSPAAGLGNVRGTAFPGFLPELDCVNQLMGGVRMAAALRRGGPAWVVAAVASYGYAAVRSGRPYACWIGTGLADEWRSRRERLPRSRRLALRVNAPVLLHLERAVLRGATAVYATSPASRSSVASAAGLPADRVGILPIPVDTDRFAPLPDGLWADRLGEPTVVFVGRGDDPRKNTSLLLDAFRLLRQRLPKARLRMVGGAPQHAPEERVEVAGEVPSVPEAIRDAAVFVLPSRQEGFGLVVAEALACGLPVVVTPCGGPEELVRASKGGVVLPDFSPETLAQTLLGLLTDEARLRRLRAHGREYVSREHAPERFRELLREALEVLSR